jgi:hypothetical protein
MRGRSTLPQRVVRFYGNTDFALDAIAHRQVTFVHLSKLNDPFDPYFFFETDFGSEYDGLLAYVQKHRPSDVDWFMRHLPRENWQKSVEDIEKHMEHYKNTTFVLSCSAVTKEMHPRNNLYMWGHYGNGHKGVAIELDTLKAASLLADQHNREKDVKLSVENSWIQIEYAADMPPITTKMFFEFFRNDHEQRAQNTSLERYYNKTARVKSLVWRQEYEWRMLWHNDETHLKIHRAPIPEDAITAVYVGLAASSSVAADMVFETQRKFPAAKIFKAQKKPGFSELEFRQIGI